MDIETRKLLDISDSSDSDGEVELFYPSQSYVESPLGAQSRLKEVFEGLSEGHALQTHDFQVVKLVGDEVMLRATHSAYPGDVFLKNATGASERDKKIQSHQKRFNAQLMKTNLEMDEVVKSFEISDQQVQIDMENLSEKNNRKSTGVEHPKTGLVKGQSLKTFSFDCHDPNEQQTLLKSVEESEACLILTQNQNKQQLRSLNKLDRLPSDATKKTSVKSPPSQLTANETKSSSLAAINFPALSTVTKTTSTKTTSTAPGKNNVSQTVVSSSTSERSSGAVSLSIKSTSRPSKLSSNFTGSYHACRGSGDQDSTREEKGDSEDSDEVYTRSLPDSSRGYPQSCSSAPRSSSPRTYPSRRLWLAAPMAVLFMAVQAVGGHYSSSLAILFDSGHLLCDALGLLATVAACSLASRPATPAMTFGYHRAEVLSGLTTMLLVWLVSGLMMYASVQRVLTKGYDDVNPDLMIITAAVGVLCNICLALVLHGHPFSCLRCLLCCCCGCCCCRPLPRVIKYLNISQSSSTTNLVVSRTLYPGTKVSVATPFLRSSKKRGGSMSIALQATLVHVYADTLMAVAVLLTAVSIKYEPGLKVADPAVTMVCAALSVLLTAPLLGRTCKLLLQGAPSGVPYRPLLSSLEGVSGVRSVHCLHVWTLAADRHVLSVHLVTDPVFDHETVRQEAVHMVQRRYPTVHHCTVQVERHRPTKHQQKQQHPRRFRDFCIILDQSP